MKEEKERRKKKKKKEERRKKVSEQNHMAVGKPSQNEISMTSKAYPCQWFPGWQVCTWGTGRPEQRSCAYFLGPRVLSAPKTWESPCHLQVRARRQHPRGTREERHDDLASQRKKTFLKRSQREACDLEEAFGRLFCFCFFFPSKKQKGNMFALGKEDLFPFFFFFFLFFLTNSFPSTSSLSTPRIWSEISLLNECSSYLLISFLF